MLEKLQPWEALLKRILWAQLGDIQNKKILDFGSGIGVTANYYAKNKKIANPYGDGTACKKIVETITNFFKA